MRHSGKHALIVAEAAQAVIDGKRVMVCSGSRKGAERMRCDILTLIDDLNEEARGIIALDYMGRPSRVKGYNCTELY